MVKKEYQNLKFQQPYQQAMYYCSLILQDRTWPWMEELEILPHLEADDLAKFVPLMLSRASFECYIAGSHTLTFQQKYYIIKHIYFNCFKTHPPNPTFFFFCQGILNAVKLSP